MSHRKIKFLHCPECPQHSLRAMYSGQDDVDPDYAKITLNDLWCSRCGWQYKSTADAKLEKVAKIAKKHSGTNWHAGINEYREWILEILSIVEESNYAK